MKIRTLSLGRSIIRLGAAVIITPIGQSILAATNDPTALLQKALFEEEANHNLPAAIQAYQDLVSALDENRKLAATAVFRLGECYRKQGRTNEAAAQYQRVTRDFSDQSTLVTLSQQNLSAMGIFLAAAAGPRISDQARQQQKQLLEEEIKLVEKDVADKKKMVESGVISQDEIRQKERELLGLKRQLAGLDTATTAAPLQSDAESASATSEALEIKRIQAMIKDSPDLINGTEGGLSPLYSAAQRGQLKVAEFLLANGASISKGPGKETPLHAAVKNNQKEMLELLLNHGANVNAGAPGQAPLHLAANAGLKTICEVLIAHKADVNARAENNFTPLHFAAQKGFKSIVELLLAHGADVNATDSGQTTALFFAAQNRQGEVAGILLSHEADPNLARSGGMTPLHLVAQQGTLAMAQLLLTNHANVNVKDNSGNTPLHAVAASGQPGIIEALLAYKADINAKNLEGATPLIRAMAEKQWAAARLLIASKADLNFACSPTIAYARQSDLFPIHVAMVVGSTELLELLLKNGADPNARTNQTIPPLGWAINQARTDWANLLLKYKADPNLIFQRFPLLISAINQSRAEIVQSLLEHGADPKQPDPDGRSPLIRAVSVGQIDVVQSLLEHKADVNARWSGSGDTPLHIAVANGRRDIIDLLLAHGADPNLANNDGKTPLALTKPAGLVLVSSGSVPIFGAIPPQPTTFAARLQQITNPNTTPAPSPEPPSEIRDLLLKHGAVEDLPHFDRIDVRRSGTSYSATIFHKDTNDWNRFTLYELLAVKYNFLTTQTIGANRYTQYPYSQFAHASGLDYPDLSRIRIRHPAAEGNQWRERTIDLNAAISSGDCSGDAPLEWGDVVEIPEQDHPLNVPWPGLSEQTLVTLKKCLTREVEVTVKGQSKKITLAPDITVDPGSNMAVSVTANASFLIWQALSNSKLLLASSDLSHIKVRRIDPKTRKPHEWVVDCSDARNPPGFWLQDGDVIQVPDRS